MAGLGVGLSSAGLVRRNCEAARRVTCSLAPSAPSQASQPDLFVAPGVGG